MSADRWARRVSRAAVRGRHLIWACSQRSRAGRKPATRERKRDCSTGPDRGSRQVRQSRAKVGDEGVGIVGLAGSDQPCRVQLTTDGHLGYLTAIEREFGRDVDYAMLIKTYGSDGLGEVPQACKYSPQVCTSQEVRVVQGNPDPERISTSYIERSNLTLRMGSRRFTRLTNAFSKKLRNHAAAVALHHMHCNFARPHRSLANPYPRTPAMAAGIADHIWTCEEIADLLE